MNIPYKIISYLFYIVFATRCVNSLIYFGLSLNTADLGDNDYVTFFISAAVEFPANLIVIPLIQSRLGRRYSEFGILFIGGVCCLITSFLGKFSFQHFHNFFLFQVNTLFYKTRNFS